MDTSIYSQRRNRIMSKLGEGVLILGSLPESVFSNDVHYRYRQHSNLLYFVNFPEPNTTCIIENREGVITTHLFVPKRDKQFEIWNGRRYGVDGAKEFFNIEEAYDNTELEEKLLEILKKHMTVFYTSGENPIIDKLIEDNMRLAFQARDKKGTGPINLINPRITIDEIKSVKSDHEIKLIRKAAQISADAHSRAIRVTKPGLYEYQIEAILEYEFRKHGGRSWAYPSIVGSGVNATILHYIENNDQLKENDLLLVDAATEFEGYAADITRTWPVKGKFNEFQKRVYQAVLDVQKQSIEMVKPGVIFNDIQEASIRMITEKLVELGLLKGNVDTLIQEKKYRRFFMHGLGHWLGMDTHDTSFADLKNTALVPGNYFTIEPGIYIPDDEDIPVEYRGIGVRIEDDILVTEDGYENLSQSVPKEIDEIEKIVGTELLS